MIRTIQRLRRVTVLRYLFVGCSSYVIELGCLLLLMHAFSFSASEATASAYWLGLLTAFTLQKVVAFQDYRRELKILTKQGVLFSVLTVWNWIFTVGFVALFPADDVVWTRSIALVLMSSWNYIIYKRIIFR